MKRNILCNFGTDSEEFEHYVGHRPSRKEMDDWVYYLEKGINAQLDWDILNKTAAEAVKLTKEWYSTSTDMVQSKARPRKRR
jgi:hypothetical protein